MEKKLQIPTAKIVAHSLNRHLDGLVTFELTLPRFILPEFNTHREFSRNSASSRAIPFNKMVKSVIENPFIPVAWQKKHSGMQGKNYVDNTEDILKLEEYWLKGRDNSIEVANIMHAGQSVTKQLLNRMLEPYMWHKVIMTTSTPGLQNFFNLRCPEYSFEPMERTFKSRKEWVKQWNDTFEVGRDIPKEATVDDWSVLDFLKLNQADGEIHISLLAEAMYDAFFESNPKILDDGEYHIPFSSTPEFIKLTKNLSLEDKIKVSVGMCARVSYTPVGDESEITAETYINIYNKMSRAKPFHASPFEHVAHAMSIHERKSYVRGNIYTKPSEGWCRNFKGFVQLRETLEQDFISN